MWQPGSLEMLVQDLRYGARYLRRAPGFTVVAVAILAIGIGATTAIFSAVETMLLKPLPFAEPERLMDVGLVLPSRSGQPARENMAWSWPKYVTFRDNQPVFASLALWSGEQLTLGGTEPERDDAETVSARYLTTLGVRPALGSDFSPDVDVRPNPPAVALISDNLWQRRFNADPAILNRTIDIDRTQYAIIGVLPPGFRGLSGRADIWTPILARRPSVFDQAMDHEFSLVARLRPGVSVAQGEQAAIVLGARVDAAHPDLIRGGKAGAKARVLDQTRVDPRVRRSLLVLLGAVTFVLLIACANIANLFLVRAASRQREIAVRLALGAGRARLVRQLLTESVLLAAIGGAASLVVAWWGVRWLGALNPSAALRAQRLSGLGAVSFASIHLDVPAFVLAAALALITGLLFGLVPALQATRTSVSVALKEGAAIAPARRHAFRWASARDLFVVIEIALALVLLVGSGLMIRSLSKLLAVSPGFDATHVLTLRLTVPPGLTPRDSMPGFYAQLLERLRSLPGVTNASLANCPPLSGGCNGTVIWFRDRPPVPRGTEPSVGINWVSPDWFAALHVPLERGRFFTEADRLGQQKVVLVNHTAAQRYWPSEDPIGKRIGVGQGGFNDSAYVVGVVGDVRFGTIDSLPIADVFISFNQSPQSRMLVFVRTQGDPIASVGAARRALHELAPDLPAYDVRTLDSRVADATAQARFSALLLAMFAGVALALAAVGIYGVMSFVVAQRTREIGIRVALGAARADVVRLVVGQGVALAAAGLVIGLAAAVAAARVLRSLLFDVTPSDPRTFAAVVALLGGAALVASWIPARRATRIDPTEALRTE